MFATSGSEYPKNSQTIVQDTSSEPYLKKGIALCKIPHTCPHLESKLQKFPNRTDLN
jgi:hypothetical protein